MNTLDHLIVGCSVLEDGVSRLEKLTGVRAAAGGKHPLQGTHNALLSLGSSMYLEILAPDPEAGHLTGFLAGVARLKTPALFTWAAAVTNIESIENRLRSSGYETSGLLNGERKRTDGSLLRWRSLRLVHEADPVIPFLIQWDSASAHPSSTSPQGCVLKDFSIHHPEPQRIRDILQLFELSISVRSASKAEFRAILQTPAGEVTLP